MTGEKLYPVNEHFHTFGGLRSWSWMIIAGMLFTHIYALASPDFPQAIRYVGKADKPQSRLSNHCIPLSLFSQHHRANWLRSLKGRKPVLTILEKVPVRSWQARERYWIKRLRGEGHDLVNATAGGEGGATCGMKGKRHSEETKCKISASKMGRRCTMTVEARKALGAQIAQSRERNRTTNLGRTWTLSAETKARLSVVAKQRVRTKKGRAQILLAARLSVASRAQDI